MGEESQEEEKAKGKAPLGILDELQKKAGCQKVEKMKREPTVVSGVLSR